MQQLLFEISKVLLGIISLWKILKFVLCCHGIPINVLG